MDDLNVNELVEFYRANRQVYSPHRDYGRRRDIETVLVEGKAYAEKVEEKWQEYTLEAVRIYVGRRISVEVVGSDRRPDIDIYYEHEGERVYLLRNHVTDQPWRDAFEAIRSMLEDEIALERHSTNSGRFSRIMHNAEG